MAGELKEADLKDMMRRLQQESGKPGSGLDKLDLTVEEADRLTKQMENPEFRNLLTEYMDSLSDPQNRQEYDDYIKQMERENGPDACGADYEIVHVHKCICYKGKNAKGDKVFVNLCKSEQVQKPRSEVKVDEKTGQRGTQWELPHLFAAPHRDKDRSGKDCACYDVVFHNDTLLMGEKNPRFLEIVHEVAVQAVNKNANEDLNPKTMSLMRKLKYMGGVPVAQRVRKDGSSLVSAAAPPRLPAPPADTEKPATAPAKAKPAPKADDRTPVHSIVHRGEMDLSQFTQSRFKGLSRPKELVVKMELPKMEKADDMDLDIHERLLTFKCKDVYELSLPLPFPVNDAEGSAKFNKNTKLLTIVLPVLPPPPELLQAQFRSSNEAVSSVEDTIEAAEEDVAPVENGPASTAKITEIETLAAKTAPALLPSLASLSQPQEEQQAQKPVTESAKVEKVAQMGQSSGGMRTYADIPDVSFRENTENVTAVIRVRGIIPESLVLNVTPSKLMCELQGGDGLWRRFAIDFGYHVQPERCRCDVSDMNAVVILKKAQQSQRWDDFPKPRAVSFTDQTDEGHRLCGGEEQAGQKAAHDRQESKESAADDAIAVVKANSAGEKDDGDDGGDSDDEGDQQQRGNSSSKHPLPSIPAATKAEDGNIPKLNFINSVMYELD